MTTQWGEASRRLRSSSPAGSPHPGARRLTRRRRAVSSRRPCERSPPRDRGRGAAHIDVPPQAKTDAGDKGDYPTKSQAEYAALPQPSTAFRCGRNRGATSAATLSRRRGDSHGAADQMTCGVRGPRTGARCRRRRRDGAGGAPGGGGVLRGASSSAIDARRSTSGRGSRGGAPARTCALFGGTGRRPGVTEFGWTSPTRVRSAARDDVNGRSPKFDPTRRDATTHGGQRISRPRVPRGARRALRRGGAQGAAKGFMSSPTSPSRSRALSLFADAREGAEVRDIGERWRRASPPRAPR